MLAVARVHEGLLASSRMPSLARAGVQVSAVEVLALIVIGAGAAVLSAALPDFHLRIPGHAIIRSVFPMALGMAFVPRRFGGMVMGGSGLTTALVLKGFGVTGLGAGALTSLALTGPLLDIALLRARRGWQLYLAFILAGLTSNLVAFLVRGGFKFLTFDFAGGRPAGEWWSHAVITYPLCGVLAGFISACVWFQFRGGRAGAASGENGS